MNTQTKSYDFPPSLAMLLGAAAGLAAGVFIAGRSGEKLRAEVGGAIDDLRQQGSQLADQGIRKLREVKSATADVLKQKVSGAIDGSEKEAHEVIDNTVSAVQTAAAKSHRTVAIAADTLRTGTA